nr:CAP domain-containing protein [Marinicella sp. W31]MDC2879112.1 CAP domain-containing protein [Marinicella sp. W31]
MTATFLPWVNELRQSRGLPPVSASRACTAVAVDQASRMALADKMNHITGSEAVAARFKRNDLPLPAAENIAMHQATPERAFQAWVNSPGHLKNMLGNYSHLGVAKAASPNSGNTPFWSMCLSQ